MTLTRKLNILFRSLFGVIFTACVLCACIGGPAEGASNAQHYLYVATEALWAVESFAGALVCFFVGSEKRPELGVDIANAINLCAVSIGFIIFGVGCAFSPSRVGAIIGTALSMVIATIVGGFAIKAVQFCIDEDV